MSDQLRGWDEIAGYLHVHRRTVQRSPRYRTLPIQHQPGGGSKSPVFAYKSDIDNWLRGGAPPASTSDQDIAELIVKKINALSLTKSLYRRNLAMRFALQRFGTGVQVRVETEYELINGSGERQPYIQEVTVDDCERGYVESMSISVDGKLISFLKRPEATRHFLGYASYQGPKLLIEPSTVGKAYTGKAAWIINRSNNDFWYLHVGIPTYRVKVETIAPPDYEITPSFSVEDLLVVGTHFDIAWKRR